MKIKKIRMSPEVRRRNYESEIAVGEVLDSLPDSVAPLQYASGSGAGPIAEDLFLRSWINFRARWFIGVEKAPEHDDRFLHIDFYLTLNYNGGYQIGIDVKASVHAKTEFLKKHPETREKVVVLVASANMDECCVRQETIGAVRKWLSEHDQRLHRWFNNQKPKP